MCTLRSKVLEAVNDLHKAGYVHNDLHSGNVVIETTDENDTVVHLIDFGSARRESGR